MSNIIINGLQNTFINGFSYVLKHITSKETVVLIGKEVKFTQKCTIKVDKAKIMYLHKKIKK